MTAMFEVQTGVPLPEIDRSPKGSRRKYPVEGMEVGAMFFVPNRSCKSVSAYISRITKGIAGKFSARHCWMKQANASAPWELSTEGTDGAVEGTGVWRLE